MFDYAVDTYTDTTYIITTDGGDLDVAWDTLEAECDDIASECEWETDDETPTLWAEDAGVEFD